MRLILVRHGETDANEKGLHVSPTNTLTVHGREQAGKAADRLKDEHFDAAYVSDLPRTRETASIILQHHPNVPVFYDSRLRERDNGALCGTPAGTLNQEATKAGIPLIRYRPEGGTSMYDVRETSMACLRELHKKYAGRTVLVVSHGGTISQILMHLEKADDSEFDDYMGGNTAVTIIELDDERHKIHLLNCTKHLD